MQPCCDGTATKGKWQKGMSLRGESALIVQVAEILKSSGKTAAAHDLTKLVFGRSTCYRILKRYEATGTVERLQESGHSTVKMGPNNRKKLVHAVKYKKVVSTRKLSWKLNVEQSYVEQHAP